MDFRNTVIILTSNLGASSDQSHATVGFASAALPSDETHRSRMLEALKQSFRPEFINRIDDIVIFNRLTESDIRTIASLFLNEVAERASSLGITVCFDDSVLSLVAKEGFDPIFGARPLRRAVIRLVEDSLSTYLLAHRLSSPCTLDATVQDGVVRFQERD